MKSIFIKIFTFFLSVYSALAWQAKTPTYPNPYKTVDMSKFEMTFSDEFDGELDRTVWGGEKTYGQKSVVRRGSFWNKMLAYTENGKLIIPVKYLENGMDGTGAGWYTAALETSGREEGSKEFSQKFGYFEVRCILPKGGDIWSAFWMMNSQVGNVDGSGRDGTEVDIMESPYYTRKGHNNVVYSNLHWDGYGDAHQGANIHRVFVKGNPYEEFNTYGLEWNENEYIVYINGQEYARSSAGGVCQNPLYLILSVEMYGENGVASGRDKNADEAEFIIDYVRAYQYKSILNAQ